MAPRIVLAGMLVALLETGLHAGPYSLGADDPDNPYDAPIAGFVGPEGDGVAGGDNVLNPLFKGWASRIVSYEPAPGVSAGYADSSKALGPVTGNTFDTVTLGDLANPADTPGQLTLGFEWAITNGEGADFAVFENGFYSEYTTTEGSTIGELFAELAYVEVSTDGIHFARFPSISLMDGAVGAYGSLDPSDLFNLAGKHGNTTGGSWGTPFDLDDLSGHSLVVGGLLNLDEIHYVRLVDIPGSGTFLDSEGHPIYDAWVTFGSGGFDLEALGVIHQVPEPSSVVLVLLGTGGWLVRRRRVRGDRRSAGGG